MSSENGAHPPQHVFLYRSSLFKSSSGTGPHWVKVKLKANANQTANLPPLTPALGRPFTDGPHPEGGDDAHLRPADGEDKATNHFLQRLSDPIQFRGTKADGSCSLFVSNRLDTWMWRFGYEVQYFWDIFATKQYVLGQKLIIPLSLTEPERGGGEEDQPCQSQSMDCDLFE